MLGQGSGKTPLSEAQGFRLLLLFNFALPTPSSAQGRGATIVPVCVPSSCFVCCIYSLLCFFSRLNTFSPIGAVGVDTFHPGCTSFPRLTPRLADGPREVFRMTSLLG